MEGPLTITDAMPLLRDGTLTPRGLLEQCLARIDAYEPCVQAWAYLDRDRARLEADALTDELKNGKNRGPLHGIPVGVKDIIDVFDMPTGCGSKLWANSYARRDAAVVAKLRRAGALILGKTVTTPYAYLDPPPTRNPWDLSRTPGGSSSGSAAAVACGMCLASLSTQTGGSTARPASYCGVASLKPSWGGLSVDGVLPLAPSLDHVGVMAHSVRDLNAINDIVSNHPSNSRMDYDQQFIEMPEYRPAVMEPVMQSAFHSFRDFMKQSGWMIHQQSPPPSAREFSAAQQTIYGYEASQYHYSRWQRQPRDYPDNIASLIRGGREVPESQYAEARAVQRAAAAAFRPEHPLVTPATSGPAPDAATTGDPAWQSFWTFLGAPTVSLPLAADGLPLAVQLIGVSGSDGALLRVAERLEAALNRPRRLPPVPT